MTFPEMAKAGMVRLDIVWKNKEWYRTHKRKRKRTWIRAYNALDRSGKAWWVCENWPDERRSLTDYEGNFTEWGYKMFEFQVQEHNLPMVREALGDRLDVLHKLKPRRIKPGRRRK